VYPNPFLRPMEPAVNRVIERVTGRQPAQAQAAPAAPAAPRSEARASGGAPAAATTSTPGVSRPDAPQGSRP
jgi:hypothetical protein